MEVLIWLGSEAPLWVLVVAFVSFIFLLRCGLWLLDAIFIIAAPFIVGWYIAWMKYRGEWREVRNTGVWSYWENAVTGRRRVVRVSGAYQPVDQDWLEGRR